VLQTTTDAREQNNTAPYTMSRRTSNSPSIRKYSLTFPRHRAASCLPIGCTD